MSHIEALAHIKSFNLRYFRRRVEPKPDPPSEGVIYEGRAAKKLTRNEAAKRLMAEEIPTTRPDEIRRKLYPRTMAAFVTKQSKKG